ncbi:unnamed protein product, partial [Polarella glacialis]
MEPMRIGSRAGGEMNTSVAPAGMAMHADEGGQDDADFHGSDAHGDVGPVQVDK